MANFAGISAAGKSIERLLNHSFQNGEPVPNKKTKAVLARTNDFEANAVPNNIGSPALSIFIYRVDFNKAMRAAWSAVASQTGRAHLPLDLHFLISPWAENADFESLVLGKAMECLETTPILGGPLLHSSSDWASNDGIQIVLEEISTEAVMRIFDSLPTDYRLSVPYIARIVRIDSQVARPDIPVTTSITGKRPLQPV
jgi:hypothetical protein